MKKFIINNDTVYIKKEGRNCVIKTLNNSSTLKISIGRLVNESCNYYGSSLSGRLKSSSFLLKDCYKCPIIVSESKKLIFFPTSSPYSDDCIWINYNYVETVLKMPNNRSKVIFDNNIELNLNISKRTIENQIYKSSRLNYFLNSKIS